MTQDLEQELRLLRSRVLAFEELLDAQERTVMEQAELLEERTEEALSAARAKSAFLANMSHEIRTPLNAVLGMAGLLTDTKLTAEQQEYAQTIRSSGEHLLGVINDILDFSKMEAGGLELELLNFDLRTCLQEAFDMIAPKAREKALDLAFLIDDGVPQALICDIGRLRQVLVNLLGNAVKFTEEGGSVSVRISAQPKREDTTLRRLRFTVQDTGVGIPADRLGSLFEAFTQADVSTTRLHGGTGLGLAISRHLVELLGGRIWAESEPGRGSSFHFEIEAEPSSTPVPVSFESNRPFSEAHVLAVDDLQINRKILAQQLRGWGLTVRSCSSPAEALEVLRGGAKFDLAILDFQMPGMDGLGLAQAMQKLPTGERLPVIMLSSGGTFARAKLEGTGIKAVLQKPARMEQLRSSIRLALGEKPPTSKNLQIRTSVADPQGGLKILLAEDNPTNQRVGCLILRKLGYEADVAGNGQEAIEALKSCPYDLVLMDLQMPVLDGLEATRRIRKAEAETGQRRVTIIALTARAMQGDADLCLAAGMDGYLTKPIVREDLERALSDLSGPSKPAEPEPAPPSGEAIDAEVFGRLESLCAGDDEQLASLISDHLSNSLQLVASIKQGAMDGDQDSVMRAAHSLKSSTAMFGALRVSRVCDELEFAKDGIEPLLKALDIEYRQARAALSARVKVLRA